jgi:hypothetical protein
MMECTVRGILHEVRQPGHGVPRWRVHHPFDPLLTHARARAHARPPFLPVNARTHTYVAVEERGLVGSRVCRTLAPANSARHAALALPAAPPQLKPYLCSSVNAGMLSSIWIAQRVPMLQLSSWHPGLWSRPQPRYAPHQPRTTHHPSLRFAAAQISRERGDRACVQRSTRPEPPACSCASRPPGTGIHSITHGTGSQTGALCECAWGRATTPSRRVACGQGECVCVCAESERCVCARCVCACARVGGWGEFDARCAGCTCVCVRVAVRAREKGSTADVAGGLSGCRSYRLCIRRDGGGRGSYRTRTPKLR